MTSTTSNLKYFLPFTTLLLICYTMPLHFSVSFFLNETKSTHMHHSQEIITSQHCYCVKIIDRTCKHRWFVRYTCVCTSTYCGYLVHSHLASVYMTNAHG